MFIPDCSMNTLVHAPCLLFSLHFNKCVVSMVVYRKLSNVSTVHLYKKYLLVIQSEEHGENGLENIILYSNITLYIYQSLILYLLLMHGQ